MCHTRSIDRETKASDLGELYTRDSKVFRLGALEFDFFSPFVRLASLLRMRRMSHISSFHIPWRKQMNTKFAMSAALAVVTILPMTVDAQNLFRTGRPDYARTPSYNWQLPQDYSRGQVADGYANSSGRTHRSYSARPDLRAADDYRRLEAAWDTYRREALRYQQRFGNAQFTNSQSHPYPSQQSSYSVNDNTLDYSREGRPIRSSGRCEARSRQGLDGYERNAADFRPTLRPTVRPDETPDWTPYEQLRVEPRPPYGQRPTPPRTGQFGSNGNSYLDPTKTASRPVADFFDSLLSAL